MVQCCGAHEMRQLAPTLDSGVVPHIGAAFLCVLGLVKLTLHCPFSPCSNLHFALHSLACFLSCYTMQWCAHPAWLLQLRQTSTLPSNPSIHSPTACHLQLPLAWLGSILGGILLIVAMCLLPVMSLPLCCMLLSLGDAELWNVLLCGRAMV